VTGSEEKRNSMQSYMQAVLLKWLRVNNERGAEVVEWVLWVGGIAALAAVIYGVVSSSLSTKVNTIMNQVAPISS
jgi:type VI protein secretion system component VasF